MKTSSIDRTLKRNQWAGRILTGFAALALAGSATTKIAGVPKVVEGLIHAGIPPAMVVPIAILELTCLTLYLIPSTAALGAVLLTGYLGAATLTHIIGGENIVPPLAVGAVVWGAAWFRIPAVRALVRAESAPASGPALRVDSAPASRFSRFAPVINRLALVAATLVFTMIGLRYITDPVRASADTGVALSSALAATTTRVGFGAFPLGLAIFSFTCLFSSRRMAAGVRMVAIVIATAIAVRLMSIATDGMVAASTRLFIPEAAMLLLAIAGLSLEAARRKPAREEAA